MGLHERSGVLPGEPVFGYLVRHRGRRIALAFYFAVAAVLWSVFLPQLGVSVYATPLVAGIGLAVLFVLPSEPIFRIATAMEIAGVRALARCAEFPSLLVVFATYSLLLGWINIPWSLSRMQLGFMFLVGVIVAGMCLRYATKSLFAANVKGPTRTGAFAIFATLLLPMFLSAAAVVMPHLAPYFGAALIGYGYRTLAHYFHLRLVMAVEPVHAFGVRARRERSGDPFVDWVHKTEHDINRSLIERGYLRYAVCYLLYVCGKHRSHDYREAFRHLRVQKLYASRKYQQIAKITSDRDTGLLLYLRIQSLIRSRELKEALQLIEAGIRSHPDSPYFLHVKAQLALEQDGFHSRSYRQSVAEAHLLATRRLRDGDLTRHICPDAIAEKAKIDAYDAAFGSSSHSVEQQLKFRDAMWLANEARKVAYRHSVRLGSEIRSVEGVVTSLYGDYSEAYRAHLDALATGENLKARYYLAMLLMVGSVTFLRPIYHFERILAMAPADSRLSRLARARRDEAVKAWNANRELAASWDVFKLFTFSHEYLAAAESTEPAWNAVVVRTDDKKEKVYRRVFGREPSMADSPDWVVPLKAFGVSSPNEVSNEEIKREVPVPAVSVA